MVQVSGTVLSRNRNEETALDHKVELGCTRMDVRRVKATRAEESNSYSSTLANKGREGCMISSDNLPTLTLGDAGNTIGVIEVEDEICVLEESLAVDSVVSKNELLEEGQAACCGWSSRSSDVGWGCH